MFNRPGDLQPTEQRQQASVMERASLYSFELNRLNFIRELFTKDSMYRLNKEQMFVEALVTATETRGIKLPALKALVTTMKNLSPNDLGRGRDEIVKILTPVPVMATLGTAYGEEQPGFFARIINAIRGKGGEQQ